MKIYLAQSSYKGCGGVEKTSKFMKIYLASWPPLKQIKQTYGQRHADNLSKNMNDNLQLRILLSYWYYKNVNLEKMLEKHFAKPYPDIFVDSGAYSAMTQGVKISVKEYSEWVNKYKHLISVYANLDVIMNAEKTWKNQQLMESYGLSPLPVFHVNEDFKWLNMYCDKYNYIALGIAGMGKRNNELMRWLVKCFKVAKNKAVFHGFGLTIWKVMKSFKWYSVDSSSWGSGFRYGRVPLFDVKKGNFSCAILGNVKTCKKNKSLIHSLGFNWLDFAIRKRNDRVKISAISALSYMLAEKYLRKFHGNIYLADANKNRFADANEGIKIYLADANKNRFADANEGIKIYLANSQKKAFIEAKKGLK